jgi:nucleoside-diphosphate-sugar epimerase
MASDWAGSDRRPQQYALLRQLRPGQFLEAKEIFMRVFVTGATGFIGSAVVQELLGSGHQVTGLARSEASAKKLTTAGAQVHRGSMEDLESLRRGASAADGAIHTAFFHEITHMSLGTRLRAIFGGRPSGIVLRFVAVAVEADRRVIETLGQAFLGSDRPLVATFGTMAMKPGHLATEDEAYDPDAVGGPRGASEDTMLMLASRGVRTSVIRLPPLVHGDGDYGGFAPRLIKITQKKESAAYVGDGLNRWPAVHRLDAARLFRLAMEQGVAGSHYHGVADEGVPFREITEVIGRRLIVPVVSKSAEEAAKLFSWLAPFMPVDNPASSELTQERLGWTPTHPGLIADLNEGHYFER